MSPSLASASPKQTAGRRSVQFSISARHAKISTYGGAKCAERGLAVAPTVAAPAQVWLDESGAVHVCTTESLRFSEATRELELKGRAGECRFAHLQICWRVFRHTGARLPQRVQRQEFFDAETVGSPIILRHWQPGDRFQAIGLPKAAKLQDLLTNARIPARRRRALVVAVAADGRLFWVEGLRIGEPFKLTPRTNRRLQWLWQEL